MFLYKSKHTKASTDHGAGFCVFGLMYIEQKPCAWQRFFCFWGKSAFDHEGMVRCILSE